MCLTARDHEKMIKTSTNLDTLTGYFNKPRRVLKRAHTRQGGLCIWCDRETFLWWEVTTEEYKSWGKPKMATREHMTPRSEGGDDTDDNITCACYRCNTLRGTISENQFKWVTDKPKRLKRLLVMKQQKRAERNRVNREKKAAHSVLMETHAEARKAKNEKRKGNSESEVNHKLIKFAKAMNHHRRRMTDIRTFTRTMSAQQEWDQNHGLVKFARQMRFAHQTHIRGHRAFVVVLLNYMLWRYPPCQEPVKTCQSKVVPLSFVGKVKLFFGKVNLMKVCLKHALHSYASQSQTLTIGDTCK